MKGTLRAVLLSAILMGALGCGGNEPMNALGDASQSFVGSLSLPFLDSTPLSSFTPFSTSNDGFNLFGTWTGTVVTVVSPGAGIVSANDGSSVTILHNVRVASRIRNISSSVQAGNYVAAGSQIGFVSNLANTVRFSVLVDNVAVCPLSFLTNYARQRLQSAVYSFYSQSPCQ